MQTSYSTRYVLTFYKPTFGGTSADDFDFRAGARGAGNSSGPLACVICPLNDGGGNDNEKLKVAEIAPKQTSSFDGFWGGVNWVLNGGIENGVKYDWSGNATGVAPSMGEPFIPGVSGGMKLIKAAAKGSSQFMKYQGNFVLKSNWKNWGNYMSKRGWAFDDIQQTLLKGKWTPHSGTNYLNPGNPMSIVTNPSTGKSLIIDNVTKEVIQLGGKGFKY